MINNRFTLTSTQINTTLDIVLSTEIIKNNSSVIGNTDTRYLYPLEIQIINDCGAGVEWLLLSNLDEYNNYIANPTSFVFVRLPYGHILQENFNSLGRCYKFVIRGYETTATDNLICEFINYKPSLF